jgi:hypothetical protein
MPSLLSQAIVEECFNSSTLIMVLAEDLIQLMLPCRAWACPARLRRLAPLQVQHSNTGPLRCMHEGGCEPEMQVVSVLLLCCAAGPSTSLTALAAGPAQPVNMALATPVAFFPLSGAALPS